MARRRLILLPNLLATGISGSRFDWLAITLNKFANRYNTFIEKLRGGVFDLRDAKALSQLWREVERCGEWPKPEEC
jgi:hypothetical protein